MIRGGPPGRPAAAWWGMYVRRRVGMRHHPLAELLSAFITTKLTIEHVAESGERTVPTILAIRARKRPFSTPGMRSVLPGG
jgi:hypothetical protein